MSKSLDLFEERSDVIQLFLNGASQAKIFRDLGPTKYSRSFISRTVKRFKETGKIEDRPRSGRPRTIRTGANVRKICQMLTRKPILSHRSVAARERISRHQLVVLLKTSNYNRIKITDRSSHSHHYWKTACSL